MEKPQLTTFARIMLYRHTINIKCTSRKWKKTLSARNTLY